MSKTYYMHTINGMPAFFADNKQICYMSFYGRPHKLAKSLKQIRKEQKLTREFRMARGCDDSDTKYSYRRVTV